MSEEVVYLCQNHLKCRISISMHFIVFTQFLCINEVFLMLSKATVLIDPRCMLVVRIITCVAVDRLALFINSLYQSYYFLTIYKDFIYFLYSAKSKPKMPLTMMKPFYVKVFEDHDSPPLHHQQSMRDFYVSRIKF